MIVADGRCLNCGADAPERFCPRCGQSTRIGVPTMPELVLDSLGAIFSYDSKLWRTIWRLVRHPGILTVDYLEGRRTAFLSPFQVFVWLQTATFLVDGAVFRDDPATIGRKTRGLVLMGVVIALLLALLYVRRRLRFVHHLVAAAHAWAFLMLVLLVEYAAVPLAVQALLTLGLLHGAVEEGRFVTTSVEAIMVAYTTVALRRIYRVSLPVAFLQTLAIFLAYAVIALRFAPGSGIA